jgi:peptidoglycan/LPS O-acetylase OafA/YrhL
LHFAVLCALVELELLAYAGYPYLLNHEPFNPSTSGPALVASLFLVQGLAGPTQAWNGPSWSISLEVWVYAGFVAAVASGRPRAVGAVVAVVTALLAAGVLDLGEAAKSVAPYLLCFVLGCLASSLFSRFGNAFRPRRWFATLLETAMVGAIIAGTIWCPRSLAPAFAVAVFLFACERGLVSRVLRWRPFVILGLFSYSIYMVHWLVLDFAWIGTNLLRSRGLDLWGYGTLDGIRTQLYGRDAVEGTAMLLCFLAATFAFGALTYRFIEAPGRRWARRHANAIAPQAVPAEAVARS